MKITIAGDFATTCRGERAIEDGNAFSQEVITILRDSDISIVNLESPVADDGCDPIEKVGPNLRTSCDAIKYLKEVGVDVVTLANNHFYDYGEEGVVQSLICLKDNNIQYVGGGRTEEEKRKILYVERDNCKVAILNYCEAEFSVKVGGGSNHVNPIDVYYDIQESKKNADFVIAIMHGGHEGYNLPSPRMQQLYRFFIDAGANVVVNHHQHCFSGYEEYHGGKIFYGLGNYFFDEPKDADKLWTEGFMLQLELVEHSLANYILIPYVQCTKDKAVVKLMNDKEQREFNDKIGVLNGIITDQGLLEKKFTEYANIKKGNYRVIFAPYSNRYLKALCKRGFLPSFFTDRRRMCALNDIRCEAHRDLLIESLLL